MQRNWDVIRVILLEVESKCNSPSDKVEIKDLKSDEYDENTLAYHSNLLIEAGLVQGKPNHFFDGRFEPVLQSLTWSGHELVDSIRDDNIWSKTKATIAKVGSSVGLEALKTIAASVIINILPTP